MQLTFHERLTLLTILPEQSDYAGMKEIRRAREICSLTPDEVKKYGVKQPDGQYHLKTETLNSIPKEIPLGEWLTETIRDKLRALNEQKKLEDKYMTLFEKFVVNYQQY